MYSAESVKSLAFVNAPYLFYDICLIHSFSVGDVLTLKDNYSNQLQLITMNRGFISAMLQKKKIDIDESTVLDPFEFLMTSAKLNVNFLLELQKAFYTFIQEEIIILPSIQQVVVGSPQERRILNKDNFLEFQNIIRIQNKIPEIAPVPENEDPRARKFREKRELRDAIKNNQTNKDAASFTDSMCALCTYGIGITPFNIKDLSLFTFYNLLSMAESKEKYDTDIQFLCGGADPKTVKPKYWITNN